MKMKSTTLCLIIFITKLTVSKSSLDDFSIDQFITSLKNEGLFNIILSIKNSFGQDVAIISCEELNQNHCGNCKKVVTDYMPNQKKSPSSIYIKQSIDSILKDEKQVKFLNSILAEKFSPEEVISISNGIIEKFNIFKENKYKIL